MELSGLKLSDIHPSQFYISLEKLRQVEKWFRPDDLSHFEPVPVKYLNGRIIFTDGHTRAFAAYRKGLAKIPLVWDEDELDWEAYQLCADACSSRGIHTISDLQDRVVDADVYQHLWNDCAILCMKYWHCAEAALPYIRTTMVTEMNHDCITDKRNKKLYGQAPGNGML